MNKARFEAFTDAIVAIVVTILVLELPKPESYQLDALLVNWESYLVYMGSFVVLVGVWFQHHNLFHYAEKINRKVFWANALWLLIQSFLPYISSWMADYPGHSTPVIVFLTLNMLWALSYRLMYYALCEENDMPAYPWSRTLSYLAVLLVLILLALWYIPLALVGLILFNVIGLIIGRDLEI